jgi:hypothetical protein
MPAMETAKRLNRRLRHMTDYSAAT